MYLFSLCTRSYPFPPTQRQWISNLPFSSASWFLPSLLDHFSLHKLLPLCWKQLSALFLDSCSSLLSGLLLSTPAPLQTLLISIAIKIQDLATPLPKTLQSSLRVKAKVPGKAFKALFGFSCLSPLTKSPASLSGLLLHQPHGPLLPSNTRHTHNTWTSVACSLTFFGSFLKYHLLNINFPVHSLKLQLPPTPPLSLLCFSLFRVVKYCVFLPVNCHLSSVCPAPKENPWVLGTLFLFTSFSYS